MSSEERCRGCGGMGKVAIDCEGSLGYKGCPDCDGLPFEELKPAKIEEAPEVSLACGADFKVGKVALDLVVAGNRIRLHLDEVEVVQVCRQLMGAAGDLRNGATRVERSSIVLPRKDGVIAPLRVLPRSK